MNLKYVMSILMILPLYAFAAITGSYNVFTTFPDSTSDTAQAVITEADGIYTITWIYSDLSTETGTGVRKDDAIAFVWLGLSGDYGVSLYEIHHNRLEGPFATYGDSVKGYEVLTRTCHSIPIPPPVIPQ